MRHATAWIELKSDNNCWVVLMSGLLCFCGIWLHVGNFPHSRVIYFIYLFIYFVCIKLGTAFRTSIRFIVCHVCHPLRGRKGSCFLIGFPVQIGLSILWFVFVSVFNFVFLLFMFVCLPVFLTFIYIYILFIEWYVYFRTHAKE